MACIFNITMMISIKQRQEATLIKEKENLWVMRALYIRRSWRKVLCKVKDLNCCLLSVKNTKELPPSTRSISYSQAVRSEENLHLNRNQNWSSATLWSKESFAVFSESMVSFTILFLDWEPSSLSLSTKNNKTLERYHNLGGYISTAISSQCRELGVGKPIL